MRQTAKHPIWEPHGVWSLEGRISRGTFAKRAGVCVAAFASFVLLSVSAGVFWGGSSLGEILTVWSSMCCGLPVFAVVLCLQWCSVAKRLRDLGASEAHAIAMLIPLLNAFMLTYLLFAKGQEGPNEFGEDPKGARIDATIFE